ncbi:hypothetical protein OG900_32245 [Streptomyces sp. NBC_00433]
MVRPTALGRSSRRPHRGQPGLLEQRHTGDTDALAKADGEINAAAAEMAKVTARVDALGGQL